MYRFIVRNVLCILLIPGLAACVSSRLAVITPKVLPVLPKIESNSAVSLSYVSRGIERSGDLCFYSAAVVSHAPYVRFDDISNVTVQTLASTLKASGVTVDDGGAKHVTIETTDVSCVPKGVVGSFSFKVAMRAQIGNVFSKEFSSEAIPDSGDCGIGLDTRTSEGSEKIWQDCIAKTIKMNVNKLIDNRAFKDYIKY